jgi:hypothetical protein
VNLAKLQTGTILGPGTQFPQGPLSEVLKTQRYLDCLFYLEKVLAGDMELCGLLTDRLVLAVQVRQLTQARGDLPSNTAVELSISL